MNVTTENTKISRKSNWDFAKTILMFIVIYGHVCPALSGNTYTDSWCAVTRITGLFVMPLWFFISGYFQSRIDSISDLCKKLKKTLLRIALPLLAWGCILILINLQDVWNNCDADGFCQHSIVFIKHAAYRTVSYYWFLSALLICVCFGSLLSFAKSRFIKIGMCVLLCSLPVFIFMKTDYFYLSFVWFYYGCGMLYREKEELLKAKYNEKLFNYIVISLSIVCIIIGYHFYPKNTFYMRSNLLWDTNVSFIVGRFILCLTASVCALYWIFKIYKKFEGRAIVDYITNSGRDTLFIYCSHVLILSYLLKPFIDNEFGVCGILDNLPYLRYYIIAPLLSLVLYVVLQCLANYLKRNKLIKVLFMGLSSK